jgi:hypothetical protein
LFALALAAGFILKTKADGWKLFCQRVTIPPFTFLEGLPGFHRLERALARAQEAAFVPEGFLRWLNDVRPPGQPEVTDVPLTVEGVADEIEKRYRQSISRHHPGQQTAGAGGGRRRPRLPGDPQQRGRHLR